MAKLFWADISLFYHLTPFFSKVKKALSSKDELMIRIPIATKIKFG
jgi:hypothetical protein